MPKIIDLQDLLNKVRFLEIAIADLQKKMAVEPTRWVQCEHAVRGQCASPNCDHIHPHKYEFHCRVEQCMRHDGLSVSCIDIENKKG